ncbi:MAG: hypothetical protein P4L87_00380, partial [Formivibrio sp.]|nr:hypothetical protein [Formivibrio sp.]
GECPVQSLDFVGALRRCISHDDPLFCPINLLAVCLIWDAMSIGGTHFFQTEKTESAENAA